MKLASIAGARIDGTARSVFSDEAEHLVTGVAIPPSAQSEVNASIGLGRDERTGSNSKDTDTVRLDIERCKNAEVPFIFAPVDIALARQGVGGVRTTLDLRRKALPAFMTPTGPVIQLGATKSGEVVDLNSIFFGSHVNSGSGSVEAALDV